MMTAGWFLKYMEQTDHVKYLRTSLEMVEGIFEQTLYMLRHQGAVKVARRPCKMSELINAIERYAENFLLRCHKNCGFRDVTPDV